MSEFELKEIVNKANSMAKTVTAGIDRQLDLFCNSNASIFQEINNSSSNSSFIGDSFSPTRQNPNYQIPQTAAQNVGLANTIDNLLNSFKNSLSSFASKVSDSVLSASSASPVVAAKAPEAFQKLGYNAQKGSQLSSAAIQTAKEMSGSKGWCYRGVIKTLSKLGITGLTGGSAYMAADQLAKRNDFKEVSISKADLKNLPAGAIVVWGKGNTENTKHGHISVALGNGQESSDHINNQYMNCGNGTFRIFIPV